MAEHPLSGLRCRHCGQTLQRMMLLAMLQDAGAEAGLDADLCPEREDVGQHDFTKGESKCSLPA